MRSHRQRDHGIDLVALLFLYFVTLVYMTLGYVSWMVTQVLLPRMGFRSWKRLVYIALLIAAFVFTVWDLATDPITGTVYHAFTYRNPGAWFGTPRHVLSVRGHASPLRLQ